MPKESKKFINPLLRPSQQVVESKRETPPQQEKSATEAGVQTAEAPTSQRPAEPKEKSMQTSSEPFNEAVAAPDAASTNGGSARARHPRERAKTPTPTASSERQAVNGQGDSATISEQGHKRTQVYKPLAESSSEPSAQPPLRTLRPELATYDAHVSLPTESTDATIPEEEMEAQNIFEGDASTDAIDESEVDFSSNPSKARRNKGAQAFEKTHVRFTVWVDKSLKQSFEDLAFQRDKPKTTLLNEAIADLVRKYETP